MSDGRISVNAEMQAYDMLPADVRRALDESDYNLPASELLMRVMFGKDGVAVARSWEQQAQARALATGEIIEPRKKP